MLEVAATRHCQDETAVCYSYTHLYHNWPGSLPNDDTEKSLTHAETEAMSIILERFKKWTL